MAPASARTAVAVLSIAYCMLAPQFALGTEDPVAQFNRAAQLAEDGQVAQAVDIWLSLEDVLPQKHLASLHNALGLSLRALNDEAGAWHYFSLCAASGSKLARSAAKARGELASSLRRTHVKVEIRCPPGSRIAPQETRKNLTTGCPGTWWYPRGRHVVEIIDPNGKRRQSEVKVAAGKTTLVLDLTGKPPQPPIGKAPAPEAARDSWWKWGLLAGGAASLLAGGGFQLSAHLKNESIYEDLESEGLYGSAFAERYDPSYEDEVKPRLVGAYALYGLGGALAVTGLVFLLWEDHEGPDAAVAFCPLVSGDGAGAYWGFRF